jgi:transcriptional regulator with XRE-family HTH domain
MAPKRETAQEIWGNELAHAMEAAGMTGRQLAQALNVVPSTVSQWVNGRRTPHIKDVERIDRALGTNGYLKREQEKGSAARFPRNGSEWFGWRAVEEVATEVLAVETTVINGLLQSPEYARVVLDSEDLVAQRLARQEILDRENAPFFEVLLDESILYRNVGGPKVMSEALAHLVRMAERDNIMVRIIPFSANTRGKLASTFSLATVDGGGPRQQASGRAAHRIDPARFPPAARRREGRKVRSVATAGRTSFVRLAGPFVIAGADPAAVAAASARPPRPGRSPAAGR